jgi:hypothetical protein
MVRPGEEVVVEEAEDVDTAKASLDESHDPYYPPVVSLPLVDVMFSCLKLKFRL